ncbi:MAG TPA: hypothetical protein PKA58_07990 [Polyangium sp.]|nr:hypothetical protein [Polyangium sp.]
MAGEGVFEHGGFGGEFDRYEAQGSGDDGTDAFFDLYVYDFVGG